MNIALKIIIIVICAPIGLMLLYQIVIRIFRKIVDFPAPAIIGRFLDSDFRRRIQRPECIISRSGITEGMKVLEIGCGSGAYTTYIARSVGENGQVFALDIQEKMLDQIKEKLKRPENTDIGNVRLINSSAYELPFKQDSLDLVYFISVFQEIPDASRTLKEVKRVLKPNGILAISEFLVDPDYPFRTTTVKQGRNGGFKLEGIYGNFFNYTARFRND